MYPGVQEWFGIWSWRRSVSANSSLQNPEDAKDSWGLHLCWVQSNSGTQRIGMSSQLEDCRLAFVLPFQWGPSTGDGRGEKPLTWSTCTTLRVSLGQLDSLPVIPGPDEWHWSAESCRLSHHLDYTNRCFRNMVVSARTGWPKCRCWAFCEFPIQLFCSLSNPGALTLTMPNHSASRFLVSWCADHCKSIALADVSSLLIL